MFGDLSCGKTFNKPSKPVLKIKHHTTSNDRLKTHDQSVKKEPSSNLPAK
jgi:hypothetical protein